MGNSSPLLGKFCLSDKLTGKVQTDLSLHYSVKIIYTLCPVYFTKSFNNIIQQNVEMLE